MEELICHGNRLKTLDVGRCPVLNRLDCARNQLARLNLGSKKGFFVELICEKNQLKSLDVRGIRLWEDGIFRYDRQVRIIRAANSNTGCDSQVINTLLLVDFSRKEGYNENRQSLCLRLLGQIIIHRGIIIPCSERNRN